MEWLKQYAPATVGLIAGAWVAAYAGFHLGAGTLNASDASTEAALETAAQELTSPAFAGPHFE